MMQLNEKAVRAAADEWYLERFIESQRPFIVRCASKCTGKYVTPSDDEYAVALEAFYEAVRQYQPESGPFSPYAGLVIRRRLTDYSRTQRRYACEIALSPQGFDGALGPEEAEAALQRAVEARISERRPSAKAEIEEVNAALRRFGFTFYDLSESAPRTDKTRRSCARAAACLVRTPLLLGEMRRLGRLPVQSLAKAARVAPKLLERHRRYIIAAAILLSGDYPVLCGYLREAKKAIAAEEALMM